MNSTLTEPNGDYLSGQMLFLIGSVATAASGMILSFGRSLLDNMFSILFLQLTLDEDSQDSAEQGVVEKMYQHILGNQSRLQGWKSRLIKAGVFEVKSSDIHNHTFTLPEGGYLFWIGWHPFYTWYTPGGKNYWSKSKLDIFGFRISKYALFRLINGMIQKPDQIVKYRWTYGTDDIQLWKPGRGRNKYVSKPIYIPTQDTERVLKDVQKCVEAWKKEDNAFIKQCNKSCFLLWGPHGTFKTSLVKLISHRYRMDLHVITQNELHEETFSRMMESLESDRIVLIDDIDLSMFKDTEDDELTTSKGKGRNGRRWGRGMKAVIKSVMDGTVTLPNRCFFFICCNNTELDADINSRFTPYYLGYADDGWRKELFGSVFSNCSEELKQRYSDLYQLNTEGSKLSQREIARDLARYHTPDPEMCIRNLAESMVPPPEVEEEKEVGEKEEEETLEELVGCWL